MTTDELRANLLRQRADLIDAPAARDPESRDAWADQYERIEREVRRLYEQSRFVAKDRTK